MRLSRYPESKIIIILLSCDAPGGVAIARAARVRYRNRRVLLFRFASQACAAPYVLPHTILVFGEPKTSVHRVDGKVTSVRSRVLIRTPLLSSLMTRNSVSQTGYARQTLGKISVVKKPEKNKNMVQILFVFT